MALPSNKGYSTPGSYPGMGVQGECSGPDFAMGELIVHRTWVQRYDGMLTGVAHKEAWYPGVNTAKCMSCHSTDIRKPDRRTGCNHDTAGFYAYHDGNKVYDGSVYGIIKAYGLTTVGKKGVRAEKAEIVAIYDPTYVPPQQDTGKRKGPRLKPHDWLSKQMWRNDKIADAWGFGVGLVLIMLMCFAVPFGLNAGQPVLFGVGLLLAPFAALSINAEWAASKRLPKRSVNQHADLVDWEAIHRLYPDVLYYNDKAEMLAAHPLNKER